MVPLVSETRHSARLPVAWQQPGPQKEGGEFQWGGVSEAGSSVDMQMMVGVVIREGAVLLEDWAKRLRSE